MPDFKVGDLVIWKGHKFADRPELFVMTISEILHPQKDTSKILLTCTYWNATEFRTSIFSPEEIKLMRVSP